MWHLRTLLRSVVKNLYGFLVSLTPATFVASDSRTDWTVLKTQDQNVSLALAQQ
jgi:hypothetical protein